MARKVPYEKRYRVVEQIKRYAEWSLYCSVIIAVVILVFTRKWILCANVQVIPILNTISILLSIGYFLSDIIANYLFQSAEDAKRKDLIDHSLSTQLADQNSNEYFTNNEVAPGIYKLGVNTFESCFFSKSIAEKMIWPALRKVLLIIMVFMIAVLWADNEAMIMILQMALPYTIIQQFIRLVYYKQRLSYIYSSFVTIFQAPKNGRQSNLLLHNSMTYDATHAWASIKLNQHLYETMNPTLTPEWQILKQRLKIQ